MDFSAVALNAALDGIEALIGTGPVLKIFDGSKPAATSSADTGTLLATLTLPSDWMGNASGGTKLKNGTWSGLVTTQGTAGHFRVYDSTGTTCHLQGTIGLTGSLEDIELNDVTLEVGQTVSLTAFSLNATASNSASVAGNATGSLPEVVITPMTGTANGGSGGGSGEPLGLLLLITKA